MNRKELGNLGEKLAKEFLENKNYYICQKNYKKISGEIDIVAYDKERNEYVFVEVKTRSNNKFGYPEEALDDAKLEKIMDTAELWLEENNKDDMEWRIDLIGIEKEKDIKINHIINIRIQ